MTEHPYRAGLVRVDGRRSVVRETQRAPSGVRVRAWSDGTTRMRLARPARWVSQIGWGLLALLCSTAALGAGNVGDASAMGVAAAGFVVLWARTLRGERISISPAAVSRRRLFGRGDVRALADVSTVVVSGSGKDARLDLQCGRERVPLAERLGYDEASLRWIAQRLRRALEAAR